MLKRRSDNTSYILGFFASLFGHIAGAIIALTVMNVAAARASKAPPQIFSVTLEGGEKLGGITQVPSDDPGKKRPLPNVKELESAPPPETKKETAPPAEKKLDEPSVVEDPAKLLAEKKAKEQKLLDEKKAAEEKKKLEEKKKADEEKKKKEEEEEAQQKAEAKRKEDERIARDKQLKAAVRNFASVYKGESANAGGEGFGAAALGGKGMGGGTLASAAFIAYRNALERHIKAGWRWLPGPETYEAQVIVSIMPDGVVSGVRFVASSGNSNFDESVERAVTKSSPVPQPPPDLYEQFKEVRITFNSHD